LRETDPLGRTQWGDVPYGITMLGEEGINRKRQETTTNQPGKFWESGRSEGKALRQPETLPTTTSSQVREIVTVWGHTLGDLHASGMILAATSRKPKIVVNVAGSTKQFQVRKKKTFLGINSRGKKLGPGTELHRPHRLHVGAKRTQKGGSPALHKMNFSDRD